MYNEIYLIEMRQISMCAELKIDCIMPLTLVYSLYLVAIRTLCN